MHRNVEKPEDAENSKAVWEEKHNETQLKVKNVELTEKQLSDGISFLLEM